MSEYIVTARKWRPMKFDDVAAQNHVTVTLRNAIATKRLAHAYLFSGPRGVGKTTTARLLAKAVNCLKPKDAEPDNECENCREITEGRSFDVLEIDGASNRGVEEIRNLRESVRYAPAKSRYKVYIIDEVHMLTKEAFNALLKTLEEPPSHVLFIFATTEIHKIPATILSRCQRFDFRRIAIDEIIANLTGIARKEGIEIDDDALLLVAKKGDGSLRDSQSIFDQIVSLCGKKITQHDIVQALNVVDQELFFKVTDLIKAKDPKGGLALVQEIMSRGYDIKEFLAGLTEHLRNLLTAVTTGSTDFIEESDLYRKRYSELARSFSTAEVLRLLRMVGNTESAIRWSAQPRFKLETDIVHMIGMHGAPEVGELLQRIDDLKKKLDKADRTVSASAPPLKQKSVADSGSTTYVKIGGGSVSGLASMAGEGGPHPRAVSEMEISTRWPELVGEIRRQRISLGSVLETAALRGVSGESVHIECSNDFQASALRRNKEFLSEVIQKLFNVRARVEVVVNPQKGPSSLHSKGEPSSQGSKSIEEHPVVKALREQLGAEPI
ncbi:MAG: DNA polymerase III subunit gamma/tau [Ignavibacteriae bacterium]|nr:DNA polymerase III subunit gamma/tau [Ignavibacteriota bacterium]